MHKEFAPSLVIKCVFALHVHVVSLATRKRIIIFMFKISLKS